MAALKCSRCRARIEVDGTSACSCPPAKGGKDARNFEAFRPRISTRRRDSLSGPAPDDSARARLRGRSVMVCVASAVALGSVAFSLQAMDSGRDVRGGDRPAVTISPDPDIEAREAAEDSYGSTPDQPDTGGPSLPPDDGADAADGAGDGADGGEHPGSQPPPTDDANPAPPPEDDAGGGSGDAGGGASNGGGGDGANGGGDGGNDDGDGGSDDGGDDDGGDDNGDGDDGDDGGGLLRGLITLLFGGGDDRDDRDDRDHGKDGDRRGDGGKGHHRGGGHH